MAFITSGLNWEGKPCVYTLDNNLTKNLENVKKVVSSKDFDYVAIVAGLPGMGKSNFAINCCKFLDPNFSIKNIASTAEEFEEITSNAEPHSAIMLDESFASLNSKISQSKDFVRIVNHLQIIRQKNLYIFLCLPNFFDLAKGIAIYRAHHLFVCYGQEFGDRGSFAAYDREAKKNLYINGLKYMNYHIQEPNFRGTFVKQKCINEDEYNELKLKHLKAKKEEDLGKDTKASIQRDCLVYYMKETLNMTAEQIGDIGKISIQGVYDCIKRRKKAESAA